ncbi:MICOS complex subunit MIC27 [Neoarius graeffei]|uniref:MICOS complex subunit MIC27 n=1 Tax=Neoarius graeffei TaxID=443677 RepID=UPI00298D3D8B|nr:MICOS complex subunit MIC27 [Neoarius graeffei]
MAAKVVKLAVVPAALGLASFRVYATPEEKTDKQISPHELSIYSTEPTALRYVEEKPGRLQTSFGLMRGKLQSCVRAVENTCTSVKVGVTSLYQTGQDTYNFLRDPPPGFLPRVGIITVSGLAGLILARKGSRLKRIGVSLTLVTVGAAVCYPMHTVRLVKVTGQKVSAAGSLVASLFKSKPKEEGIVPDTSLKHASEELVPHADDEPQEKVSSLPEAASVIQEFAPEMTPPEAASAEPSPAGDITSTSSVVENLLESAAHLVAEETTSLKEITTGPPVKEKPQFLPDPALSDHGQAHPEDADLYSTRA